MKQELLYAVAERFISINGEGQKAGKLAAFIRMKGCNLSCSYCDTAWANKPDCPCINYSKDQLLDWLKENKVKYVTLTGGEPLLSPGIADLIEAIGAAGMEAELETNGSIDLAPFCSLSHRPVFTVDYKCPGSGMEYHMRTDNYRMLESRDTVKFVVGSRKDLDRAYYIYDTFRLSDQCNVSLSPVFGSIDPKEIVNYMIEHHWNDARLQLQIHKFIWSPDQKGV